MRNKFIYLRIMQKGILLFIWMFAATTNAQFQFKEPIKIAKTGIDQNTLNQKRKRQVKRYSHSESIKISAVGDIMLGTQYPSEKYLPGTEYLVYKKGSLFRTPNYFDKIEPIFKSQHIVFGNLEGTFLDSFGQVKNCQDSSKCYAFKQPTHYVKSLSAAGFNLLSVANNHIGDFGTSGINSTHKTLKSEGIYHAGTNVRPLDFMEINGIKVGFIALAVGEDCVQISDTNRIKLLLKELKTFCQIVIVSMHVGAEGNKFTHVRNESEFYLNENRGNPIQTAHFCIDQGADLILGHGPHVPRAMEIYKEKLIAYSLGNFCTFSRFNLSKNNGIAPLLTIELNSKGNPISLDVLSYKQIHDGGPITDWRHRAKHRILKLSKQDFPNSYREIKRLMR